MANVPFDNHLEDLTLRIGEIQLKGFISKHGIANFLNVPYAKVPLRFRTATSISISEHHTDLDVSRYGPRCPQKVNEVQYMMGHVFENVSLSRAPDETNCLHLNIYTPPAAASLPATSRLPVFAWIHGGAFNVGDNTTQFDGNHLVKRSLEIGRPIIVVAINYRLNVFGFSSSKELVEEAISLGEDPISNQGLNDQRVALQWIQSSIHYFGGDASRVTIAGESAGAASVLCHLKGGLRLFQQALLQSPPAPRLRTPEEAQSDFDKLIKSAGIPFDASGAEKLAALRSLTSEQLVDTFDGKILGPSEDPNWFAGYDRNNQDPLKFWGDIPSWCERTIFGNTKDEAALILTISKDLPIQEIVEFTRTIVPHVSVPDIMSQGRCNKQELIAWSTNESFINPLLKIATLAADQGSRVYVYRIGCVDPFPGPLQGFSWHSFGIPLTFYQPPCRVYPELASTQDYMSAGFLNFFHGLEPWEEFKMARRMVFLNGTSTKMITAVATTVEEKDDTTEEPCIQIPAHQVEISPQQSRPTSVVQTMAG